MNRLLTSPLLYSGAIREINGWMFGRWLCKYYCGAMAMQNQIPQVEFVRYAYGQPTMRRVYFIFRESVGSRLKPGSLANLPIITIVNAAGEDEAFIVEFSGIPLLVSLYPPDAPEMAAIMKRYPASKQYIDRLNGIVLGDKRLKIVLNWSGDPDEPRVVSVAGIPTSSR